MLVVTQASPRAKNQSLPPTASFLARARQNTAYERNSLYLPYRRETPPYFPLTKQTNATVRQLQALLHNGQ